MTYQLSLNNDLIVDNFAGGGGASCGIEAALKRPVSIAINHDAEAIGMHEANHPHTQHFVENVWDINPREICKGRRVAMAWFSPDCKHFSRAKGGKPVEKKIRGLAWVVLKWASLKHQEGKPRVIFLENVEEFLTWGPLVNDRPCPKRKGETFKSFVNALKRQGYKVEWKTLRACDYGTPTIRKRLFMIARCDGGEIIWPEPTHGLEGSGLKPYRTAAECIDWSISCPSIFDRKRPLAQNTMKRIAKGLQRFVIEAEQPFIIPVGYGEREGQSPRCQSVLNALNTVVTSNKHRLVIPYLTEHANASTQRVFDCQEPLRTQCAQVKGGHFALVAPFMARHFGNSIGSDIQSPVGTVTSGGGGKTAFVSAFLAKHFGGVTGVEIDTPLPSITARGTQTQIVTGHIMKMRGTNIGHFAAEPLHTVSAGGQHHAVVCAYLLKYYGNDKNGQSLTEPMHSVTSKDRFALSQIKTLCVDYLSEEQRYNAWWITRFCEQYEIIPEVNDVMMSPRASIVIIDGWVLYDIGMRMLVPRELYRAQGFPEDYIIDHMADGKPINKTGQVQKCGNSVPPTVVKALVSSNVSESVFELSTEAKCA